MSASREKKKRQELLAGGGVDPKTAREAEQKAAEKRSKILYTTLAAIFVVVAVFLLVYNSGILQRSQTAVTIDGEKYTVADVSYYYQDAYQNFLNTYGSYASLFGLDTSKPLTSQYAWGGSEQTWDEYFKEQAITSMKFVHAAVKSAEAENMALDEDDMATLDANVEAMKTQASSYGYSYKAYLNAVYGPAMTPSVFEENIKTSLLASKYAGTYRDGLVYTDDEIETYYQENKNSYDLVDAEYVSISGAAESTTDADGNTVAATDEEKAAAMAAAKETADAILAAYQEGGNLEDLAEEHGATYTSNDEMAYNSSYAYGSWLFDEGRSAGDAEVLEDESNSRYFVAVFHSRKQNDALEYSVRHILVNSDSLELAEGEEATDEQILAKAQEILDSWDGTEDGFATLANEYSKDTGSNTNGGLYEDVASGAMVTEFNDWCYAEGRKAGDTGIVKTSYGQHIMYFVGYGDTPYWHYACNNALVSNAYREWQTALTDSVEAVTDDSGMKSVG